MDWILFIRLIIFITFLLLLAEGIAAVIMARYFYKVYVRKHRVLEVRLDLVENRLHLLKELEP